MKTEIQTQLKSVGERLNIDLIGDDPFVSIAMHKSIKRKILDMLESFKISNDLDADEHQLNKRITQAYRYRSIFSHSLTRSLSSTTEIKKFFNYYQFVVQLLFIIFLKIFGLDNKDSVDQLYGDLKSFIEKESYYSDKQKLQSEKNQSFEEFFKYLSGEKELPPGETTFQF